MAKLDPATATRPPAAVAPQPKKVAQILPAAADLFLEHGFDVVTMDMVAARSGVSKATLYVYFKSKEELFSAIVEDEARRLIDGVSAEIDDLGEIDVVLRKMAKKFLVLLTDDRTVALYRAVVGSVPRFPDVGRIVHEAGPLRMTATIAAFLATANDDGRLHVSDPTLAARQFLSLARCDFDVEALLSRPRHSDVELDQAVEAAVEVFLAAYGRA
ncbi:TetR/AcrR family transcriptional regulator [Hansschlegelia sp. KR7-227]|uniref:TetR/AcrR family transcriptional regulator n=1 Tax=Hansschlegelia sp. KR7-227 TaxID=3400914 RepID=UPI003C127332